MMRIRAGSGLGDSLYLQSVVRHILETATQPLEVATNWPMVFSQLSGDFETKPFYRTRTQVVAHYSGRRTVLETSQFEDCCINAKIAAKIQMKLDWTPRDEDLMEHVRRLPRPFVVVQLPRSPMGRTDGLGADLLPDCRVIQRVIDWLSGAGVTVVQVGKGEPLFNFTGVHMDLANRTSVTGLLDVASVADGFLGYPSFLIPLAESFARPALLVWSRRGLESNGFSRQVVPKKLLGRETSRYVVDDCTADELNDSVCTLLNQMEERRALPVAV